MSSRKISDPDLARVLGLVEAVSLVDRTSPARLEQLLKLAQSGEIRDVDFTNELFTQALRTLLLQVWSLCGPEDDPFSEQVHVFVGKLFSLPEFTPVVACAVCDVKVCEAAITRAITRQSQDEESILGLVIYNAYKHSPSEVRGKLRPMFAKPLSVVSDAKAHIRSSANQLSVMLRVLGAIVQGFNTPLTNADKLLLFSFVMPIHHVPGKVSQEKPVLALFHEPLQYCVTQFLEKEPELAFPILESILAAWPSDWAGNTPKNVLLLHELETIMEAAASVPNFVEHLGRGKLSDAFLGRMAMSLASSHSVVCERALILWKNPNVAALFLAISEPLLAHIAEPLVTRAAKHWNATVLGMTGRVLEQFRVNCLPILEAACTPFISIAELHNLIDSLQPATTNDTSGSQDDNDDDEFDDKVGLRVPVKEDVSFMNMIQVKVLGEGSFGRVMSALRVARGKPRSEWPQFALKQIDLEYEELGLREAQMMDLVSHPNCTRLIATYRTTKTFNLVLEFASKGDLHSVLSGIGSLNEESARFVAAEVGSALAAVHRAGMVFGDLKPENVLVHGNGHVKLGDFGSARLIQDCGPGTRMEGTIVYLAPEVIKGESNGLSVDWWAYGCLVYQMLAGRPPIWAEEEEQIMEHIVQFDIEHYPPEFPDDAAKLVTSLLVRDPAQRLGTVPGGSGDAGAREIENHEYFALHGVSFDQVHSLPAPPMTPGKVKVAVHPKHGGTIADGVGGGRWTQRTFSMVFSPLPQKYTYGGDGYVLEAVPEGEESNFPWDPNVVSVAAGGTDSGRKKKYLPSLGKLSEDAPEKATSSGRWKFRLPGGKSSAKGDDVTTTTKHVPKVIGPADFGPGRTYMKRVNQPAVAPKKFTSSLAINAAKLVTPSSSSTSSQSPNVSNGYKFKGLDLTVG